jgi:DNA-binding NtrC family response regulator
MFEPGNVNQLKKRIEKQLILKDNDKMEKILNYTIKNYDIKIEAKKHENIYSKILGSDR